MPERLFAVIQSSKMEGRAMPVNSIRARPNQNDLLWSTSSQLRYFGFTHLFAHLNYIRCKISPIFPYFQTINSSLSSILPKFFKSSNHHDRIQLQHQTKPKEKGNSQSDSIHDKFYSHISHLYIFHISTTRFHQHATIISTLHPTNPSPRFSSLHPANHYARYSAKEASPRSQNHEWSDYRQWNGGTSHSYWLVDSQRI